MDIKSIIPVSSAQVNTSKNDNPKQNSSSTMHDVKDKSQKHSALLLYIAGSVLVLGAVAIGFRKQISMLFSKKDKVKEEIVKMSEDVKSKSSKANKNNKSLKL